VHRGWWWSSCLPSWPLDTRPNAHSLPPPLDSRLQAEAGGGTGAGVLQAAGQRQGQRRGGAREGGREEQAPQQRGAMVVDGAGGGRGRGRLSARHTRE